MEGINAAAGNDVNIGAIRAGQQVQKMVMARLLQSVEQAGRIQAPVRNLDQVQISAQAMARFNAGA